MKKRGLLYPVIRYAPIGIPVANNNYIQCIGNVMGMCGEKFSPYTEVYEAVIRAFRRNHGKPYHRSTLREAIDNEW